MAKPRSVEAKLATLRAFHGDFTSPEAVQALRLAIADASNFLVAEAAKLVARASLVELAPALAEAFGRFLVNPVKTDKTCAAKIAIADALNSLDYGSPEVFLRGIRVVQAEPVWGGTQDTAGPLRGACAIGLVRLSHEEALPAVADLLADPEKAARVAAAQALGYCYAAEAVPLLRLKIRLGDAEAQVLSECFGSLLKVAPSQGVPVVAEYLSGTGEVRMMAALALGESRRPDALAALIAFWRAGVMADAREDVLVAIGLARQPAGTAFLLSLIAENPEAATLAVTALAVLRHDATVRQRTEAAVTAHGGAPLRRHFEERFDKG
jgi:HEAT repeat protein